MGVERICPVKGTVCPVEEIMEDAWRHAHRADGPPLRRLAKSLGAISRKGNCDGVFVDQEMHGTVTHCSNSELPAMQAVYNSARGDENLREILPESLAQVTRNE